MPEPEVQVTIQPQGKTVAARTGTKLAEVAVAAAVPLDMPCGGEGVCGKCRVVVRHGAQAPGPSEELLITSDDLDCGYRLACQSTVSGQTTLEIPSTSLQASYHQILARTESDDRKPVDPVISKRYVELPPPARGDDEADFLRIHRALGPVEVDLDLLRRLPRLLRETDFRGTAVVADGELIDFEPGDTHSECFAVAVDLGTTTLVGMLVDLVTGQELAVASRLNPQTGFGDDVLSRILHAQQSDECFDELYHGVIEAVDEIIGQLSAEADISRQRIYEVTFAGNTTMQHLLLRIDPRYLGEIPFVPAIGTSVLTAAARLGLNVHPRGRAYVLPTIGGFVGGDTVAGMLATGLADAKGPSLLVDIGTNGEIVLSANGKLWAAATAAGPAFEGARILHGMRACTGAIEKVDADGQLRTEVIGRVAPTGICGSALIDLGAELLRNQLITPEGRMRTPDELPEEVAPQMRRRVILYEGKLAFLIADESESGTGRQIVLTQRDVRQLQLASGAIRTGIALLLRRAELEPSDLTQVLVAGGFGNFIRRSRAQRIGLLPPDVSRAVINYQGNTSLAGARLVALSQTMRRQAEQLARQTEHIDLSTDHHFQWTFADSMIFPS